MTIVHYRAAGIGDRIERLRHPAFVPLGTMAGQEKGTAVTESLRWEMQGVRKIRLWQSSNS